MEKGALIMTKPIEQRVGGPNNINAFVRNGFSEKGITSQLFRNGKNGKGNIVPIPYNAIIFLCLTLSK